MNHSQLLKTIYNSALNLNTSELNTEYNELIELIELIAHHILNQKAVYTVLVTLLTHKIIEPSQDIRLHQSNMDGGFSGRTIDTKHITPTLRELGLPCMAESGWLTRSLEQPYAYTLDYQGKIGNLKLKQAFLGILDTVQNEPDKAQLLLTYLLFCVIQKNKIDKVFITKIDEADNHTIDSIIAFLDACFSYNYKEFGGSKLPVIAFHCIFQQLIEELKRYDGCVLNKLGSHTASDRTSKTAGDIEIFKNGELIEAIEIKLNKPINADLMRQIQQKIYKHNPKRYCIFSSGNIIEDDIVNSIIDEIKENHGCQIIVNGVIPTLKYYLRLIVSLQSFINGFLIAVENDSELKPVHKTVIVELLEKY
jgi:DNA (cytosine-5)-methyltransferase 1